MNRLFVNSSTFNGWDFEMATVIAISPSYVDEEVEEGIKVIRSISKCFT